MGRKRRDSKGMRRGKAGKGEGNRREAEEN